MPLYSLRDSVENLMIIMNQLQRVRSQREAPMANIVTLENALKETLETMHTLVDAVIDAHKRGDLEAMASKDHEET
jgi:hypothetical protein